MSLEALPVKALTEIGIHKVVIHPNGVACVRVLGDLTQDDIIACHAFIGRHVDITRVSMLIDLTQLDYVRAEAINQVRSAKHFCVALFGGGFAQRALNTVVGQVYGGSPNQPTRFFLDEDSAREWIDTLRQEKGVAPPEVSAQPRALK